MRPFQRGLLQNTLNQKLHADTTMEPFSRRLLAR
jgi:hypothetical protein